MLQITRQTEYAIRGLQELARRNGDAPVQLKSIARNCDVSEAFLAKIFQMLSQQHIVKSHRGVKGGYSLAREPEEIAVGEIIRAGCQPTTAQMSPQPTSSTSFLPRLSKTKSCLMTESTCLPSRFNITTLSRARRVPRSMRPTPIRPT